MTTQEVHNMVKQEIELINEIRHKLKAHVIVFVQSKMLYVMY